MLFHYDGMVDDWRDLEWSSLAIHVSAMDQTKWYHNLHLSCFFFVRDAHLFFSNVICFGNLGGLRSGSYIQILFQNMITFSFGMKTLELNILMQGGKNEHVNPWQSEKHQLEVFFKRLATSE